MKAKEFLDHLNSTYSKLHSDYENLFWISYMGDHSVDQAKDEALKERDSFRANSDLLDKTRELLKKSEGKEKERLQVWKDFFICYQCPKELLELKDKISKLESLIGKKRATRNEGYIDPKTNKFVKCSYLKMRTMIQTESSEDIRKTCFNATQELAVGCLDEYLELVKLRNQYAKSLGYEDFYAYKLKIEEGLTKKELFTIFDDVYDKTKYAFKDVRVLEKKMPGLRKPWNFGYMMAGDFTKEEDPYFQFDDALIRWGRSFAALGIDLQKGKIQLDLLDREGKYSNGFCHWPELVKYEKGKRISGSSNFTCNVVNGQVGSGSRGMNTLFHEGGHSAHFLNSSQTEVCLNHEYPPMSTAWAETQSMFLDTMFNSAEWIFRYAKNKKGEAYPFELYERIVQKTNLLKPLNLMNIMVVCDFEKKVYESKSLTKEKVLSFAKSAYKKYFDRSEDDLLLLNVPHIYAWESSCSYQGYGLAKLALCQWRDYFNKKYGYIVDNPKVGKEMTQVWKLGASKTFKEFVVLATGKKLSAKAFVDSHATSIEQRLKNAKQTIERMKKVKEYNKPVDLNAEIKMVHGKEVISTNEKSFEEMAKQYAEWLEKLTK